MRLAIIIAALALAAGPQTRAAQDRAAQDLAQAGPKAGPSRAEPKPQAPAVHPKTPLEPSAPSIPVTPDNFPRAESDLNFAGLVKEVGLGKFRHRREPTVLDRQKAVRMNRDTLYFAAVFDLDAGPVTITLPDSGKRFLSMQIIDEDAYTPEVDYGMGRYTLTKDAVGTRYVLAAVRIFVNADDPKDLTAARALQDAIAVDQPGGPGAFVAPNWEASSQVDVRTGLLALADTLPDAKGMFGARGAVDPVRRLIGAGAAWGGLPEKEAFFLDFTPPRNDGRTVYRLALKDVPVDGMWSVSVYDADGRFAPNPQKAYSVNSITAAPNPDGAVVIQFGGCDGHIPNCLPTPPDWSYLLRLYRPRPEVLNGAWTPPEATPVP
jgi:hypothetical protein